MPSERKFYKSIIQVEVISEEPMHFDNLSDVVEEISVGDSSGMYNTVVQNETIDAATVIHRIAAHDTDPGFFSLDDHGNDADPRVAYDEYDDDELYEELDAYSGVYGPESGTSA